MKRIVLTSLVAVVFVACQDGTSPIDTGTGLETANFAIVDGAHGGNVDAFFLPPLVADPTGTTTEFADRDANPDLEGGVVARICLPDGTGCFADLPMVFVDDIDELRRHYRVIWATRGFGLVDGVIYRIQIRLGEALLAFRDVKPLAKLKKDEGNCDETDPDVCLFRNGKFIPIKVRIETFAGCIAANPDFEPDAAGAQCATVSLAPGGSTQVEQTVKITTDLGSDAGTLNIETCVNLRDRGTDLDGIAIGRVDLQKISDCVEITTLDGDDVLVVGTATLCEAFDAAIGAGSSALQAARMTVHRFGAAEAAEPFPAAVALPHDDAAESACATDAPPPEAIGLSRLDRLVKFARNTWLAVSDQVRAWIEPAPLWAKMAFRCNRGGCSSPTGFRTSFEAYLPVWMDAPLGTTDLGTDLVGTVLTVRVRTQDSGEREDLGPLPELANDVRLTFTVNDGDPVVLRTGVGAFEADPGIAELDFPLILGPNTVVVRGIGVGTAEDEDDGNPVNNVFAAPFGDPTTVTPLGIGELTFTAIGIQPDLVVSSLTHLPSAPTTNDDITITAVVKNIGTADAAASKVKIAVDGDSPLLVDIGLLVPGQSAPAVRIGAFPAGGHTVIATADAGGTITEILEGNNTATDAFTVVEGTPQLFVVFNDINEFDNTAMLNPNNVLLAQNLVNFTSTGPRASGTEVQWDFGRSSRCPSCSGFSILRSTIVAEGFTVNDISSSAGTLTAIAPNVKVIFLWLPSVAFTVDEINTLKAFAADGGRIVFVGEWDGFMGPTALAVQNQLLINMGADMRNIAGMVTCGRNTLPGSLLRPHQVTTGMTEVVMGCASIITLGPNDVPLWLAASQSFPPFDFVNNLVVIAGVAQIDTTPITALVASAVTAAAAAANAAVTLSDDPLGRR